MSDCLRYGHEWIEGTFFSPLEGDDMVYTYCSQCGKSEFDD